MSNTRYKRLIEEAYKNIGFGESKDCTVIALSIVAEIDYDYSHAILSKLGRKRNRGFNFLDNLERIGNFLNLEFERFTPIQLNGSSYTMKTIGTKYNKGSYFVLCYGHIAAMINGVIEDWTYDRKHIVQELIRVKKLVNIEDYKL